MTAILERLWRLIKGPLQWRLLWLAHAKFNVAVSGVILNDKNQVLLLKHRYWPAEFAWGFPGGYANRGERLEEALAREVWEETGYLIETQSLLRLTSGYKLRVEVTYLAHLAGGSFQRDEREILEAGFFSRDELPQHLLKSHRKLILEVLSDPEEVEE